MSSISKRVNTVVVTCAIVLCVVACTLTFLLPAESLIVDLVYQGF